MEGEGGKIEMQSNFLSVNVCNRFRATMFVSADVAAFGGPPCIQYLFLG